MRIDIRENLVENACRSAESQFNSASRRATMRKLSNKKIQKMIKMKLLEKSNGQIAKHFGVTTRRVQQIFRFYWKTGAIIIMVLPCRDSPC